MRSFLPLPLPRKNKNQKEFARETLYPELARRFPPRFPPSPPSPGGLAGGLGSGGGGLAVLSPHFGAFAGELWGTALYTTEAIDPTARTMGRGTGGGGRGREEGGAGGNVAPMPVGMLAALFALQVCDRVHLYGFTGVAGIAGLRDRGYRYFERGERGERGERRKGREREREGRVQVGRTERHALWVAMHVLRVAATHPKSDAYEAITFH